MKILILNILISTFLFAECSDLNYSDCLYWSSFCEWNEDTGQCQEIGGGGGGSTDGPYEYSSITESDGLRNGPDYKDGVLYYPIGAPSPYKSIVFTPGWGGNSASMSSWATYFASHGFLAMTVGPNDEINDSHEMRGEGLIDGIETIIQENSRINSPLYGMIDVNSYSVGGYSMGGGASQNAAMLDSNIKAVISLNPTVIFEDCNLCPLEDGYCICLVPEFVNHFVPSLIFAGQLEVNELPAYDGMLGQDIYENIPESTEKIMFEGAGDGHGFAAYPYGEVQEYALNWLKYQLLGDVSSCEALLDYPTSASQYLSNIECTNSMAGDLNGDSMVNIQDIIIAVNIIVSGESSNNADLNSDGFINILDIVLIVNIILSN